MQYKVCDKSWSFYVFEIRRYEILLVLILNYNYCYVEAL